MRFIAKTVILIVFNFIRLFYRIGAKSPGNRLSHLATRRSNNFSLITQPARQILVNTG